MQAAYRRYNEFLWLFVLVLFGLLLRLGFLYYADLSIEADEAIVGLMAKHINDGHEIPVFYYGQHYMGSLEALCAAFSFRLFGQNVFALKLVPLLFSLGLITEL